LVDGIQRPLLALEHVVEKPVELLDLIGGFLSGAPAFDFEFMTTPATDNRVVLKFGEPSSRLMMALRAFDREAYAV
jgi:hypothetical protein